MTQFQGWNVIDFPLVITDTSSKRILLSICDRSFGWFFTECRREFHREWLLVLKSRHCLSSESINQCTNELSRPGNGTVQGSNSPGQKGRFYFFVKYSGQGFRDLRTNCCQSRNLSDLQQIPYLHNFECRYSIMTIDDF
jgi:hypothetical protein